MKRGLFGKAVLAISLCSLVACGDSTSASDEQNTEVVDDDVDSSSSSKAKKDSVKSSSSKAKSSSAKSSSSESKADSAKSSSSEEQEFSSSSLAFVDHFKCDAKNMNEVLHTAGYDENHNYDTTIYICKNKKWVVVDPEVYDIALWSKGKDGETRRDTVVYTGFCYVFDQTDGNKWRQAGDIDCALKKGCTELMSDSIARDSSGTWYRCRNNNGQMLWQEINDAERLYGDCDDDKKDSVVRIDTSYYKCKESFWSYATMADFKLGACRESIRDSIGQIRSKLYWCNPDYSPYMEKWVEVDSAWVENFRIQPVLDSILGVECNEENRDLIKKSDDTYYYCHFSGDWVVASPKRYDTYGEPCTESLQGRIINGAVNDSLLYYCSVDLFSSGDEFDWQPMTSGWSWAVPKSYRFNENIEYDEMMDSRDKRVYKIVKIFTQTWMAENLNYADSLEKESLKGNSWCALSFSFSCENGGRFYTWEAANDAICPDGWRLPTYNDWEKLADAVGPNNNLKSLSGWQVSYEDQNGEDIYGFTALPVGFFGFDDDPLSLPGYGTKFWSATEYSQNSKDAYALMLSSKYTLNVQLGRENKKAKLPVRCLKNEDDK